jgi:hypothetical protein
MKRVLYISGFILASMLCAEASVSFKWANATAGSSTYWANYPTTPIVYANTPSQYTVLTYITGDTTVDLVQGSALQTSYGSGAGQDIFVGATNTTLTGKYTSAPYTVGAAGVGAGSYVGSYAYFVLVAMPLSNFLSTYGTPTALPVDGSVLIGVSAVSGALTQYDTGGTPPAPQSLNVGNVRADIALVPEPSSFALLGIGLGLVGLRRFRRK